MNGLWIDMTTIMIILFHLNYTYFWMLFQPHKIVQSVETVANIERYSVLRNKLNGKTKSVQEY